MAKKEQPSDNYLEFVPIRNDQIKYEVDENNQVTLFLENKGLFNWIFQKCFHKPRFSQIHLDKMGNFIWPLLDGSIDILTLGEMVKNEFGDEAEPLYERLIRYLKTMESYNFIKITHANRIGE